MIAEVLKRAQLDGVELYLENDQLKYRVKQGRLSPELKQQLIAHKETILSYLRGAEWKAEEIAAVPRDGDLACSFAQQRLWFVDQLEGGSTQYNLPAALRLRGRLDREALQRALDTIVERHEVLRTVYRAGEDGAPLQVIRPVRPVAIRTLDVAEEGVLELARQEAAAAFDLGDDLMLRVTLARLGEEELVLLFTMHHIASDGWSMGVLVREFVALYSAYAEGRENPLAPLAIQYADYAQWQRAQSQAGDVEYWKERLSGIPQIHSLPLDKPRPVRQSFTAQKHQQRFDRALLDRLQQLGREQDATLFMVLQSAFALLLARWSRESDIVMAVPTAGRTVTAVEPLIGFFINTLVFRSDLSRNESFRELLARAKTETLEAYAHQHVPFETLVDELKPERALSYNPLCQIKFVLQNHRSNDAFRLQGLEVESFSSGVERIRFDLDLTASESPDGLLLNWSFKEELFEAATIERMAESFRVLVSAILENPDTAIQSLPLLADASAMLAQSRGEVAPRAGFVHRAFEAQAEATPEAPAVRFGETVLTYRELNERANRFAHYLIEQGVEGRVGLYAERSPDVLVGMLAILKAGATYVPFEPSNTAERLRHIIANGDIEWVLVQSGLVDKLPVKGVDVVLLDEEPEGYPSENPEVEPAEIAYVMYTSGSTGVPKGVEIFQAGLFDYCAYASERYYAGHLEGSLVVTSHGFDITVPSLYVPLMRGGCVTWGGGEDAAWPAGETPARLVRLTPMHVAMLMPSEARAERHVFVVGGEAFPVSLARELQAKFPNAQIFNHYGPTETVVGCAMFDVSANLETIDKLPIGRPMANTELYVLNEALQVNPAGVAGELHIGGAGVAKGYVKQPELTSEKFIANPYGEGRLYKSGDLVRWLPDGNLEFLGRVDHQVKIRGFRIEPGEIESVIKQTAKDALVVVQGEGEHKALVAYVVADEAELGEIKLRVKSALPEYMVPTAWCALEAFPLNANGKIDRKRLPAIDRAAANQYVAPSTQTEQKLAEIWREILKLESLPSITANFFELGGHSLLATRVVSAVGQHFQKTLGVRVLFEHNTIRALAAHLGETSAKLYPATATQQGMYFHGQLDRSAYIMELHALLEREAADLRAAWQQAVVRHEALRTAFVLRDDALYQSVSPQAEVAWHEEDLSAQAPEQQQEIVDAYCRRVRAEGFDFAQPGLQRVALFRLAPSRHQLVWSYHNLVLDGHSANRLLAEILGEATIPATDYPRYVAWLESRDAAAAREFWRGMLGDFNAPTRIPTDRQQAEGHGEITVELNRRAIEACAAANGTSVDAVLQLAWAYLLHRYSGESDVVFGAIHDGRDLDVAGIADMVGNFHTVAPMRVSFAQPKAAELLRGVDERSRAARQHAFLSLADIQRQSGVVGGVSLFDSVLVFESAKRYDSRHSTQYALTLTFHIGDALTLTCGYAAQKLSEGAVRRMLVHLESVLAQLPACADLAQLDLVAEDDREQLAVWNGEKVPFAQDRCIHQLIEQHAAVQPDHSAVELGEAGLTYRELNEAANRLAHWLIAKGVRPDTLVGISVERSIDMIVGIVAILKAGGGYVPLDPNYPTTRLQHMVSDSGMSIVLTQSHLVEKLPLGTAEAFLFDRGAELLASYPSTNPLTDVSPANLSYVIYTSGSTGLPKGVMIEHRHVVSHLAAVTERYQAAPRQRVLSVCSFSFDVFVEELCLSLLSGGTLVLTREGLSVNADQFWSVVADKRITAMSMPTSYYHYLCSELTPEHAASLRRTLQLFIVGGEALLGEHLARWQRLVGPSVKMWNGYGPTEDTIFATLAELSEYAVEEGKNPPIGRPLPNYECYILDANRKLCPVHVPGELVLGGGSVARGYLNRAELTAERFIDNPFGPGRLYRTGDLCRYPVSGEIEYLGRIDQQVKIRGFRVELGEIEAALLQSGSLKETVVIATGKSGEQQLIAYVVPHVASESLVDELRALLRRNLPAFMTPSAFVVLEALPLTVNGKVDKRALPAPDRQTKEAFVTPSTPTEQKLAQIWKETLKLDFEVSATANFFELGGHSLLAMRVITAISAAFSKTVPVRALFEHNTVQLLAKLVDAQDATQHSSIARRERQDAQPLSYAQQRLWFIDQLEGGSAQYNMPAAMRLTGPLDVQRVQEALDEILRRHEVLRTTFHVRDGNGVQVVNPWRPFPLQRIDLSGWDAAMQEEEVTRLAAEEAGKIFDLTCDLMMRVCLITLSPTEHVLLFAMHHVASDGWSLTVLAREFVTLYQAPRSLAPLPIQYGDYASWQRDEPQVASFQRQLEYWRRQLAGIPQVHSLPLDMPRTAVRSLAGGNLRQQLGHGILGKLKALAQANNVTMFMLLETAFALLLGRWSNEDDIVLGTPTAGRTHRDLEPLIGFFVNTLLLRTDLSGAVSFEQLLKRAQLMALDAYSNQDIPFEAIVDELKPERNLSHTTMFQITFAFENHEKATMALPDIEVTPIGRNHHIAKFDLNFAAGENAEGLSFSWNYAASLFHHSTIERMAASFETLLRAIVESPSTDVHRLRIAPEGDERTIRAWNERQSAFPDRAIHELFEAYALRAPEAVAVVRGDESLTYGELNRRADRVARWLVAQGVTPESFVGVCMERSIDTIVALLGILKAGAAYVPVDPNYPAARREAILADSGARIVLTAETLASVCEADALLPAVTPRNLAYLIYTSGSTGTPKGVMVEHRSVVRLAVGNHYVPLGERSRILHASSPSFDAATFEIWGALLNGGTLVLYPEKVLDLEVLNAEIESKSVNTIWLTAGLFEQWSQQLPARSALRYVLAGGDVLNPRAVERVYRALPDVQVINGYGPTENTTFTCCYTVPRDADFSRSIPLGKAINGTTLHVLNRSMAPVPLGAIGELYAGGPGVARGYLNQPELTAEKFVRGLYKTGDLVRFLPDGTLEFIGRADDQVKIRGFRIELGEIAAQLLRIAEVDDAVVVTRGEGSGKRLVAYVLPGTVDADVLRQKLRQELPDYMIPAAIVPMAAFPLNANGKVEKSALPEPEYQQGDSYVAPRDEAERKLAEIWQQLLKLERVGIDDNFFAIGGDSILSIQAVSRANQAGISITTRQLFEHQTIAALAAAARHTVAIEAPQEAIEGALDLLPIQREFLHETADPQHFNQSVLLKTPADFSFEFVREMVAAIYRRHDALRLRFACEGGQWHAWHESLSDEMLAASCIAETTTADQIAARCDALQRQFDLARGPLFRVVYFDLGGEGRLFLLAHHIVVDGVSWRVLLADIERAYEQHRAGRPIELGAKTSSFQQWGDALREYAASAALAKEKAYWLAQYEHVATPLPADFETSEVPATETTRRVRLQLTQAETQTLLQRCAPAYRTTINELLLSAVYLGMRRWSGSPALRVALEGHGREPLFERLDTTQTVGWFTTVFPLTLHSRGTGVADVIKSVKEQVRAVPNNGIGFGVLCHLTADPELVAHDAASRPPLVFNYLGQFDQSVNEDTAFQGAPESMGASHSERQARTHQLSLNGKVAGGELVFGLDYSNLQYRAETVAGLARHIEEALREVIAHCASIERGDFTPSDFPLARVSQEQLDEWQRQYPSLAKLYPATAMQQGMYFHGLLDRSAYVTQMYPILKGSLSPERFRQAWQTVAGRHDVFRTAFAGDEGQLHQLVLAHADVPWHEEDWRGLSADEQRERFDRYRRADKEQGFDFAQPPLERVSLFRLSEDRWQLLWTHHHLLLDGWSIPLVYQEVMLAYQGKALPAVRDFEGYMRWLNGRELEQAHGYWRELLGGFESATPVGIDKLPAGPRGLGEQSCVFSEEESRRLDAFARSQQTTLNTVMQLAWAYLLHRYSGEREVVFGSLISGRPAEVPGIEEMIGLFINMIPVKVSFAEDAATPALLGRIHRAFQESQQFGFVPLPEVQRQSGVRASEPLFQTVVAFENYPLDTALASDAKSEIEIERSTADEGRTNFKLVMVGSYRTRLKLRCDYRTEEFSDETVARLLQHMEEILRRLPEVSNVEEIDVLSDAERELMASWNRTEVPSDGRSALELFEEQVARTPSAIAAVRGAERITYAELNRRAGAVAAHLVDLGVEPGAIVGLRVQRSVEEIVGILAIWKAGAAYLPLDPSYPQERLEFMVADSGARVVLTEEVIQSAGIAAALQTPRKSEAAYVIYTSGSTGQPKGAVNTHAGLANLCAWHRRTFQPGPQSCAAHLASISFDASVYDLWPYLTTGGRICIVSDDERADALGLAQRFHDDGVTHILFPTALLEHVARQDVPPELWRHLQAIIVGGEKLSGYVVPKGSTARLVNHYGPTEATVVATTFEVEPSFQGAPPIGKPIDGVTTYVLDTQRRQVPIGVAGELYIGGVSLAIGYLNRPELTAAKFVETPFGRLYRSGDLVRFLPDGNLEFLGRIDDQVKVRGFRIELGEIVTRLLQCEGVREATVVAKGQQLVAYVAGEVPAEELRYELRRHLPDYMVPAAFVMLEALPLTANGKVDRKALPEPDWQPVETRSARTLTESDLVSVWQDVLGYAPAGIDDHFFEHGGHSLSASQAVARIRRRCSVELPIVALFENPTPAALARVIDHVKGTLPAAAPIEALASYDDIPLTFAQQRLWFIQQYEETTAQYNIAITFRVRGEFRADLFVKALGVVAQRQAILRTRFRERDGVVRQEIVDTIEVPVRIVEESDRDAIADALRFERSLPFDMANELMWRGVVYRAAEDEHWVGLTIHHAITDGWSNAIFMQEIVEAYQALAEGRQPGLAPLPIQYADYAAWQQRTLDEDRLSRLLEYWKSTLHGMPMQHSLPLDFARPKVHGRKGGSVPFAIESEVYEKLRELCAATGATPYMVLVAAFATLVARLSGKDDIVIGTPMANRPAPELEHVIGFFVNTVLLRIGVDGASSFTGIVERVRGVTLAAQQHQEFPFERLVAELQPERTSSGHPLFQLCFILNNTPGGPRAEGGLDLESLDADEQSSLFDLMLSMHESEAGLTGTFHFNAELFRKSSIESLIEKLKKLLTVVALDPKQRVEAIELAERRALRAVTRVAR